MSFDKNKNIFLERDDMYSPCLKNRCTQYAHIQRYKFAAKFSKGKILDLGCGTGYGSKILFERGNEVYGIDISKEAINYAKRKYQGPKYICSPAENLPFPDEFFDAITAFEVIEHIKNYEQALNEIYRVLKRGGDFFLSTPNPRHLARILKHFIFHKPYPEKVGPNLIIIRSFIMMNYLNYLKNIDLKLNLHSDKCYQFFLKK